MVFEEEIKRSRFITYLTHTPSVDAAKAFVDAIKKKHSDARHNCWGYNAGAPGSTMQLGFSDDGEPSGTAGKPILAQLTGSGVGEITAVVTRYSGGIKLGTGGLVKAYGGGVKQALALLETTIKVEMQTVTLEFDYADQSVIEQRLQDIEHQVVSTEYGAEVTLTVDVEAGIEKAFLQAIFDATQGRVAGKMVE